jgi:hypothetical protein
MNQRSRPTPSRQSRPRPQARKLITPAEARRRASAHVLNRMFKGAKVADGAKVRLGIYLNGKWNPNEVWIIYKNPDNSMALKSSDIVVVTKRTGRILYEGPAGDEG